METMFQKFGFALEDLEKPIGEFSGGQQTKIALIQLLLQRPDILLLDEPTNHLDIAAVEWLENYLKSYENAVIIVSHDRMFLDRFPDLRAQNQISGTSFPYLFSSCTRADSRFSSPEKTRPAGLQ